MTGEDHRAPVDINIAGAVDRDVARINDAVLQRCGHRARRRLVDALILYARWELAMWVAWSGPLCGDNIHDTTGEIYLATIKLIAHRHLYETSNPS